MATKKYAKDRMTQELLKIRTQLVDMRGAGGILKPSSPQSAQADDTPGTDSGAELRERIVELGLTNNELLQEINACKKNEDNLLKQIRVLETLMEKRVGQLQEAYNELELKSAGLQTTADQLQTAHDDISRRNNELHQSNNEFQQANQQLLQANQKLQAEVDQLQKELAASRLVEEQLRRHNSDAEERLEGRISELAKANNNLQSEISVRDQALDQLKSHVANLEQQLQDLQRQTSYQETQMKERLAKLKRNNPEAAAASDAGTQPAKIEISPDGMIKDWNTAAQSLLGYSLQEVQGFPFSILVPRTTFENVQKVMEEVKTTLTGISVDTVFVTKEGEQISVTITATPLQDDDGRLVGISTVVVNQGQQA